ncbi:MAG: hypothetical protein WKF84_20870 [Pyrinomonadaceae bacterium]
MDIAVDDAGAEFKGEDFLLDSSTNHYRKTEGAGKKLENVDLWQRKTKDTPINFDLIALTRIAIALTALLVIAFDIKVPDAFYSESVVLLSVYSVFNLAIYILFLRQVDFIHELNQFTLSLCDVSVFTLLYTLTASDNNVATIGLLFSIFSISLKRGSEVGRRVSAAVLAALVLGGLVAIKFDLELQPVHYLLNCFFIFVVGYAVACWGDFAGLQTPLQST